MSEYEIRALDASTWDAFAQLAQEHKGMGFGGCWCTWFHSREGRPARRPRLRRRRRGGVVSIRISGGASADLSPEGMGGRSHGEAARLSHHVHLRRQGLSAEGVAAVAVCGALELIAKAGGGVVEGYPHDLQGEQMRSQFLYSATRSLFEEVGFSYERPKGKKNCVMRTTVAPVKASRRSRVG